MDKRTLRAIIYTLEKISVAGEDNMNYLLGCIRLLKTEQKNAEEQEENHEEIHPAE